MTDKAEAIARELEIEKIFGEEMWPLVESYAKAYYLEQSKALVEALEELLKNNHTRTKPVYVPILGDHCKECNVDWPCSKINEAHRAIAHHNKIVGDV